MVKSIAHYKIPVNSSKMSSGIGMALSFGLVPGYRQAEIIFIRMGAFALPRPALRDGGALFACRNMTQISSFRFCVSFRFITAVVFGAIPSSLRAGFFKTVLIFCSESRYWSILFLTWFVQEKFLSSFGNLNSIKSYRNHSCE